MKVYLLRVWRYKRESLRCSTLLYSQIRWKLCVPVLWPKYEFPSSTQFLFISSFFQETYANNMWVCAHVPKNWGREHAEKWKRLNLRFSIFEFPIFRFSIFDFFLQIFDFRFSVFKISDFRIFEFPIFRFSDFRFLDFGFSNFSFSDFRYYYYLQTEVLNIVKNW